MRLARKGLAAAYFTDAVVPGGFRLSKLRAGIEGCVELEADYLVVHDDGVGRPGGNGDVEAPWSWTTLSRSHFRREFTRTK